MNNENALLNIKDLQLSFFTSTGEVKVLNKVSLSVKKHDTVGLVGESGSGKSATSHAILGLVPSPGKITGGTIDFDGRCISSMTEKEKRSIRGRDISIVSQDPMTSLNPLYTVGSQICEGYMLHVKKDKKAALARTKELLELVGINDPQKRIKQYPHELSGGMRQRIAIAMALACEPKLLIADEPTTALDVTIQAQILELITKLKEQIGMAVIIITHNLGIVSNTCNTVAVMYCGRIVEYGTVDDIFYSPKHEYTKGLLRSIPKLDAQKGEKLVPIEGNVDIRNLPEGCPFAFRCKSCMRICLKKMPPYIQFNDIHYSACWLNQKNSFEGAAVGEIN